MAQFKEFLKKHRMGVGFVAVLAPLLVLLGLQLVWLENLRKASTIAHEAALHNYLEAVGKEVQYYYRSNAEWTLSIPATLISQQRYDKIANYWNKKPVDAAQRIFLVNYTENIYGEYYVYNPEKKRLQTFPASDEAVAIIASCTPWQILRARGAEARAADLSVDERTAGYRIILNPILDEESMVVGIAGMILDEDYFRKELLPPIISEMLASYFPEMPVNQLTVTVRDLDNRLMLVEGDLPEEELEDQEIVSTSIPFVFTDWTLSLHNSQYSAETWARASFAFNVALAVLVALALIGGVGYALRVANRAVKLSEMKSDFVSNVSHELRTPLASIRVFAEFLRLGRAQTAAKVREYGEYIEAESRRLSRLINNILDFSKIESGRKNYRFAKTDLEEVVTAILKTFEVRLRPSGYSIVYEGPSEELPPMILDPDAVGQAIHNLLDNAVRYSNDSKVITVRLAREKRDVALSVEDHGCGIARDEQAKIFDRFHRVGTGLIHNVKGAGLGLSIVHHVVQAHHGKVTVKSELGKGSTFTIRLPLETVSSPVPAAPTSENSISEASDLELG